VERMRLSSLYEKMQKIAALQTNYEITNNSFADDFKNVDAKLKDNDGKYFEGETVKTGPYSLSLAQRGLLGIPKKNEYLLYYDYKTNVFACSPQSHPMCKNLATISKDVCEEANMYWSIRTNDCYTKEKDLCLALGMTWNTKSDDIFCGYKNTPNMKIYESGTCIATTPSGCQKSVVFEGATCEGSAPFACAESNLQGGNCIAKGETACHSVQVNIDSSCIVNEDYSGYYGCQNVIINKGGKCVAMGSNISACNKPIINKGGRCIGYAMKSCNGATIFSEGICEANISSACNDIIVKKGGRCISNIDNTCIGTYEKGSCCHGDYCPKDSPKCNCPNFATVC
ncbi:MAG: hypothetical protein K6E94_05230, partial [Elusimicrobiaceae bacterium]|nr:hypothetical protein [Elusimicrobiaceae bacterium]